MNVKKIILSEACNPYIGFAESKALQLDSIRKQQNIPYLSKALVINGIYMLLKCCDAYVKIIMWGGEVVYPHILFNNEITYNYFIDKLDSTKLGRSLTNLSPVFSGWCQAGTIAEVFTDKWVLNETSIEGSYIGPVGKYEAAIYSGNTKARCLVNGTEFSIAQFVNPIELHYTNWGTANFCLLPETDYSWCQLYLPMIYERDLKRDDIARVHRWTPSFFYAEPGNGLYQTGWFYGAKYYWSIGDNFTSLDDSSGIAGRAELLGYMEQRSASLSLYAFGYCEMLTEINMMPTFSETEGYLPVETFMPDLPVITFFFTPAPVEDVGDQWTNNYTISGPAHAIIRSGITPLGNPFRSFYKENPFGNGKYPTKTHMWAFSAWFDEESLEVQISDCVGIALISGSIAIFYRYKGTTEEFFTTNNYHSHSVSNDGTIIAIFEGKEVISKVTVFDLYGVKKDAAQDFGLAGRQNSYYSRGGVTELRAKEFDSTSLSPIEGILIPHKTGTFTPSIVKSAFSQTLERTGGFFPSMGWLQFNIDGNSGLVLYKMVVDETRGHVGTSIDPCFSSTVIVDNNESPPAYDHLVAAWGGDSVFALENGYIRGAFVGSHPNMRFEPEGDGAIGTYTLPPTFSISVDEFTGDVGAWDYSGSVIWGDGFTEDGEFDIGSAISTCGAVDGRTYTAASTCGQTASTFKQADPVTISGDEDGNTGDIYTASGGVGDIVFSLTGTGATINATTGYLTVSACSSSGTNRWVTIRATDECGNYDEMVVRLTGGSWVLVGTESYIPCPGCTLPSSWGVNAVCGCNVSFGAEGVSGYVKVTETIKYQDQAYLSATCKSCLNSLGGPQSTTFTSGSNPPATPGTTITCFSFPSPCSGSISEQHKPWVIGRTTYHWKCP